jgi:hypothetical protein
LSILEKVPWAAKNNVLFWMMIFCICLFSPFDL